MPLQDKLFKLAGEDAEKDTKWWADLRTASHFLMEAKKRHGQEIKMTMAPAIVVCETRRLNEKQLDQKTQRPLTLHC